MINFCIINLAVVVSIFFLLIKVYYYDGLIIYFLMSIERKLDYEKSCERDLIYLCNENVGLMCSDESKCV